MKRLVYAFYPNPGIPVRVTYYRSKIDMYEYVSALRMCNTSYCVTNKNNPLTVEVEIRRFEQKENN